jgi:hypothetical protein
LFANTLKMILALPKGCTLASFNISSAYLPSQLVWPGKAKSGSTVQ